MMTRNKSLPRALTLSARVLVLSVTAGVFLSACVEEPPPRPVRHVYREAPPPPPPPPATEVYAYPMHGQTADQQDRDHYECSQWATKQTGFDPSAPNVPAEQRIRVVSASPPTGAGTAVGAVAGAILGAAVAGPRNAGGGAIVGAITGGVIGTAAEASSRQQVREVVRQDPQQAAAIAQQASNYRRAIGACLDGRGYSVR